jgi:hypothetical protein
MFFVAAGAPWSLELVQKEGEQHGEVPQALMQDYPLCSGRREGGEPHCCT